MTAVIEARAPQEQKSTCDYFLIQGLLGLPETDFVPISKENETASRWDFLNRFNAAVRKKADMMIGHSKLFSGRDAYGQTREAFEAHFSAISGNKEEGVSTRDIDILYYPSAPYDADSRSVDIQQEITLSDRTANNLTEVRLVALRDGHFGIEAAVGSDTSSIFTTEEFRVDEIEQILKDDEVLQLALKNLILTF